MAKNIEVKTKYIAPSTGYFEIDNGNSVYRLVDSLSNSMTQDKLAEFYEIEKKKGNPVPMNSIQTWKLFEDVVNSKDDKLKNYIHKSLRNNWINTLTRVVYNPKGERDETIHNYGTSDTYSIIRDIFGNDNWIKDIDNTNALESLLKTKDVKRVNEISNVINETPMYLGRFNSKPCEKTERVMGFSAFDVRLYLDAGRGLSNEYATFLVEKVK